MKAEHSQLSFEAHDCADSIPELNKMVFAVRELGMFKLQHPLFCNKKLDCLS